MNEIPEAAVRMLPPGLCWAAFSATVCGPTDGAELGRVIHESQRTARECLRLDAPVPASSAAP
jgi:hypothetical protein